MTQPIDLPLDLKTLWPPYVEEAFALPLREYVRDAIAPHADCIDRKDVYPTQIMKDLAHHGYSAVTLPRSEGGQGLGYGHAATVFEEVGAASAAAAISLITIYQAQTMIHLYGDEGLKAKYLPQFAQGLLSSYALTEANHGSDIRQLDTKADQTSEGWVLHGEKHFITSATAAELFITLAETPVGVSVFAVPRSTRGVSIYEGENSATFGLRNGPHMNVVLDAVKLPKNHMIGTEGKGVRQAVTVLNYSRTLAGAISLGIARAAFEGALTFARDRRAFDHRVIEFQGIQWYLADMLTDIDAARLLIKRAAEALDTAQDMPRWGSEAKLFASRVATDVAAKAAQICGAHGIMENAPFGRYLRDAKAYEVAGGSSEILKNTIAKALLPIAGIERQKK